MKNFVKGRVSKKFIVFIILIFPIIFFNGLHAGVWSKEESISGMDSVYIYRPVTSPLLNNKRALMINLHGCLMSNSDMKKYADWQPTADQYGMVVVLPDAPEKGPRTYNCWDYYGENHVRSNKFNDEIISLALDIRNRSNLNIDPNQVYITGFSSGGGQANVIACLAPDIFAGVGSSAGPGLGTTHTQFNTVPMDYSSRDKAALCRQLAGDNASYLDTQLYSSIHGEADSIVSPEYNEMGANIMRLVYSTLSLVSASPISKHGMKYIYSDTSGPRISQITVSDMSHHWSTGAGGNIGYFINTKFDYPNYVTQWFFTNNRRLNLSSKIDDK